MRVYYDLHIHSCLSPCGDMDMTPNNIINMSKLLGLDIIALTDHNSTLNSKATIEVGKKEGVCVIPGMELTTSEDIHVVCLFKTLDDALSFNEYVNKHQIKIKNKADIYGRQVVMDKNDEEIKEIDNLLILATDISIMNIHNIISQFNGICYPAHIDRDSMSILATLGEIPKECNFIAAEISYNGNVENIIEKHHIISSMKTFISSDAHYLENMKEKKYSIELEEISPKALFNYIKSK